jgi:hypothetical protein
MPLLLKYLVHSLLPAALRSSVKTRSSRIAIRSTVVASLSSTRRIFRVVTAPPLPELREELRLNLLAFLAGVHLEAPFHAFEVLLQFLVHFTPSLL